MNDIQMQHSAKWTSDKALKRAQKVSAALVGGEVIWFIGPCANIRPSADTLLVTNARILAVSGGVVGFEARHGTVTAFVPDANKQSVQVEATTGSMVFKVVPRDDHDRIGQWINYGAQAPVPQAAASGLEVKAAQRAQVELTSGKSWPESTTIVGRLSNKASQAVGRVCHSGQAPWLILVSGGASGTLAAFDDRLAIIKTGAMTSIMAGSMGGERSATFHYRDITGLEYNSGMFNGVLEVLTPSYDGSANRDFWRGATSSRNANSNDPYTLSNTLPLAKIEYKQALTHLTEVRRLISLAKQPVPHPTHAPSPTAFSSLSDEIERLAALRAQGIVTDDEFVAAKASLIARLS